MNKLRILSPDALLPEKFGGYIRTFNIAKLLKGIFQEIEVLAVHENYFFDDYIEGIKIKQSKKFKNSFNKYKYYANALLTKGLVIPDKTFTNKNEFLYQLESPYFFHSIKREKIKNFILNQHNISWEIERFSFNDLRLDTYNNLFRNRNKKVEIAALEEAALILVCSNIDKIKILAEIPDLQSKIITVPNCIDYNEFQNFLNEYHIPYSESQRSIVTFVGTLNYPPNRDAVNIIISKIAPHFKKDVQFLIVGKTPPNIRTPCNVRFCGYVDDIKKILYHSDICIAPLRSGSGTRLKILEYMAMKRPVISTSKGAEGLDFQDGENIVIEDNLDLFHEQISNLLDNEKLRNKIGQNGQKLVREKYDWPIYKKTLEQNYRELNR